MFLIEYLKTIKINFFNFISGSSDEHIDQCGNNDVSIQVKSQAQRSNTTVHVCWHRSTSISMKDELLAVEVCWLFNNILEIIEISKLNLEMCKKPLYWFSIWSLWHPQLYITFFCKNIQSTIIYQSIKLCQIDTLLQSVKLNKNDIILNHPITKTLNYILFS